MLTICTRCRTPYDRRRAEAAAPARVSPFCADCAHGTAPEACATLVSLPAPQPELMVLPRSVLPVAS
jgi:hypothetical protein